MFQKINSEKTKWYSEFYESALLIGYRGSIAHGTYRSQEHPNSIDDKDVMAVVFNPLEHYFGFPMQETYERKEGEWDVVVYEVRKFFRLLTKLNPNVISLLWLPSELYIKRTESGNRLIENRSLFMSKQIYKSFVGYAYSQLHKMTSGTFEGYMGDKRKALVQKFGYDTKNAAHLVRLLRMCIEFLSTGEFNVRRFDSQNLLEIKDGKYTLQNIKDEANRLFKVAEQSYITSRLPLDIDREKVQEFLVNMIAEHYLDNEGKKLSLITP